MRRFDFEILGNLEAKKNQSESWKSPWNLFLKKGSNPVVTLHLHDFLNPSRYCTMAERQDNSQPDLGKHKVLLHIKCKVKKLGKKIKTEFDVKTIINNEILYCNIWIAFS